MKKIFIIKSTFVEKSSGLTNNNVWNNLYAVETEKEARQDCIKFQNESNNEDSNHFYKFIYMYEEIEVM